MNFKGDFTLEDCQKSQGVYNSKDFLNLNDTYLQELNDQS